MYTFFNIILTSILKFFICVCSEVIAENNGTVSTSELRWQSDFANVILDALRELNHDVGDMNTKLDIGKSNYHS